MTKNSLNCVEALRLRTNELMSVTEAEDFIYTMLPARLTKLERLIAAIEAQIKNDPGSLSFELVVAFDSLKEEPNGD